MYFEIIGVSLSTVYKAKKPFHRKIFLRKRGSGGLNKKQKEGFLTVLVTVIKKDPTTSIRKHANELKVHEKTVRTAIKRDLKVKSFARTRRHFLSMKLKEKRFTRRKKNIRILLVLDLNSLNYAIWGVLENNKCNFLSKYCFAKD